MSPPWHEPADLGCPLISVAIGDKADNICSMRVLRILPSRPREFHPEPLTGRSPECGRSVAGKKIDAPPRRLASCDSLRALAAHSLDTSR